MRLSSRRDRDWTAAFPTIRAAAERLATRAAIVDGEVAAVLPDGRTSFQSLQNALDGDPRHPLVYFAFDLPFVDGEDLRAAPLEERKARLAALLAAAPEPLLRYSDHVIGRGPDFFALARAQGLEGIVSKRRRAPYRSGRGRDWLKTKVVQRQEVVIAGHTDPESPGRVLGSLIIGYHDDDGQLIFCGKVGSGIGHHEALALRARLDALATARCPFAVPPPRHWVGPDPHWVRPVLVAEVAFTEWTVHGKLRHPRLLGLRLDKAAREVVREQP